MRLNLKRNSKFIEEARKKLQFTSKNNPMRNKEIIDKQDVLNICSTLKQSTVWEISEKIVWDTDVIDLEKYGADNSFFHSLLGAIRYQLREGYKLIYQENFSKFSEKKRQRAVFLGNKFFKEALKILFSIDILSKSNVTSYMALLDYFISKLHMLKCYETYTFPESFR